MTDLYRFYDKQNRLMYVGISINAAQRASQHKADKEWWPDVARMEIQHLGCERSSALAIERATIIKERPLHNVVHNGGDTEADSDPVLVDTGFLVGHYLLTPDPEEGFPLMQQQGYVHAELPDNCFLIAWFSWLSGNETGRQIVPMGQMLEWNFFGDKDDFEEAVERGHRARDRQMRPKYSDIN